LIAFLASFRDLCLFRRGPEDMPYSPWLLIALLAVGAIIEAVFDVRNGTKAVAIVAATVGTLATLGTLMGMLRWRHRPERFVQTAVALVSTGLVFEVIALPMAVLVGHPAAPSDINAGEALLVLVVFVLAIWQICISVNILRRALEIPVAGGVLALLLLGFVDLVVTSMGATVLGIT
jgi:hypothetical protein